MANVGSNGPTTGPIHIGHLLSSSAAANAVPRDPTLVSNIALEAAYIIEGIHVVPNKISPPDFDVEGRTWPDIHTRPFSLMISARNIDDTKDLVQILTMTITGGCQWIPILPPFNSIAIDYLSFHGDFEIITVIIHGIKLDTQMLSSAAQKVLQTKYIDNQTSKVDKSIDDDIPDEQSDDENDLQNDLTSTPPGTDFLTIPRQVLIALQGNVETYSSMMTDLEKKTHLGPPLSIIQQICDSDASKSSCVVAVEVVAELVGAIFSIEDDNTCSNPVYAERTKAINNLVKIMDQCWKVWLASFSVSFIVLILSFHALIYENSLTRSAKRISIECFG